MRKLETKLLPKDFDYREIKGLRLEAQEKLNKIKPLNIGQASRISGVSPADISVLLIWLAQNKWLGDRLDIKEIIKSATADYKIQLTDFQLEQLEKYFK